MNKSNFLKNFQVVGISYLIFFFLISEKFLARISLFFFHLFHQKFFVEKMLSQQNRKKPNVDGD